MVGCLPELSNRGLFWEDECLDASNFWKMAMARYLKNKFTWFTAAIPSDPPTTYKMPSKIAAPSPRRGVSIGDTLHQVSVVGLYFSTVFTVFLPKISSIQTLRHWQNISMQLRRVEFSHDQGSIFSSIFHSRQPGKYVEKYTCPG